MDKKTQMIIDENPFLKTTDNIPSNKNTTNSNSNKNQSNSINPNEKEGPPT